MKKETVIYDRLDAQSIIHFIKQDDKEELVLRSKQLLERCFEGNDGGKQRSEVKFTNRSILSKFLRFACKNDYVNCAKALLEGEAGIIPNLNERDRNGRTALHIAAEMHAANCIELLLENGARIDLRSDGESVNPVGIALASSVIQSLWNPEETIKDLLNRLSKTDLSSIRLLVEKTNNVWEVAYVNAMKGRVISLAALLMVAPEKVTIPIMYECVIREALSLGQKGASSSSSSKRGGKQISSDSNHSEKRKLLLFEIELLHRFGDSCQYHSKTWQGPPLIGAAQAGDDAFLKLLLKTNVDVNESDAEGNSALLWCLRSISDNDKQARTKSPWNPEKRLCTTPSSQRSHKGTTIVTILGDKSIILAADGRLVKLDGGWGKDDADKITKLGKIMACAEGGDTDYSYLVREHVKSLVSASKPIKKKKGYKRPSVTVPQAAKSAFEYSQNEMTIPKDAKFILFIVGFDEFPNTCDEDGTDETDYQYPSIAVVSKKGFDIYQHQELRVCSYISSSQAAEDKCKEVLEKGYRDNITDDEAIDLARLAIAEASNADSKYTGGWISVCRIKKYSGQDKPIKFLLPKKSVTEVLSSRIQEVNKKDEEV